MSTVDIEKLFIGKNFVPRRDWDGTGARLWFSCWTFDVMIDVRKGRDNFVWCRRKKHQVRKVTEQADDGRNNVVLLAHFHVISTRKRRSREGL